MVQTIVEENFMQFQLPNWKCWLYFALVIVLARKIQIVIIIWSWNCLLLNELQGLVAIIDTIASQCAAPPRSVDIVPEITTLNVPNFNRIRTRADFRSFGQSNLKYANETSGPLAAYSSREYKLRK